MWQMHDGWGWWMLVGWIWMAFVVGLIIWAVYAIIQRLEAGTADRHETQHSAGEILDRRYARGELTADQYQEMRRHLQSPSTPAEKISVNPRRDAMHGYRDALHRLWFRSTAGRFGLLALGALVAYVLVAHTAHVLLFLPFLLLLGCPLMMMVMMNGMGGMGDMHGPQDQKKSEGQNHSPSSKV